MLKTVELDPANNVADYDTCMGMMALLGATSAFGALPLTQAVSVLHGALKSGNFRIYLGKNNRPSAALVWAFLNEQTTEDYLSHGFLKNVGAWNSGNDLWFLSVIAEDGKIKAIIEDALERPEFKDHNEGYMLRVGANRTRRVVAFTRKGMRLVKRLQPEKEKD